MKVTIARAGIVLVAATLLAAARPAAQAVPRPPATPYPCALPSTSPGTPIRLLPVDDAASQPAFFTFRARLQAAIARRDEAALVAAADPGIRTSFGPDNGLDAFRAQLRDPAGGIWTGLGTVLALGGAFRSATTFEAPYVFARWPDGLDSFECAAVIGDRVRVRASGEAGSAVIGSVSFDIVQRLPERSTTAVRVRTASGLTGFIAEPLIRSPVAHRAIFQFAAGQWRLAAFVAGD